MVKVREDMTGKTFGRLKVLRQVEDIIRSDGSHLSMWLCECSCNKHSQIVARGADLKNGAIKSCGCWRSERLIQLNKSRSKTNNYSEKLCDEHGEYYIGYTHNTGSEFYIDAIDYDKIKKYCWCESSDSRTHRILANVDGKMVKMHRFLGYKNVDHEDRNELNNRQYNLRQCTNSQNSQNRRKQSNNTSEIIGVGWHKSSNRWRAYIKINGVQKELGYFKDVNEAITARLTAEKELFGEFAPQRHLFQQYDIVSTQRENDKI